MPEVFQHSVGYVEDLNSWMDRPVPDTQLVKGLAIKLYDAGGNPIANINYNRLRSGAMRELRLRGHSVGAWACPRTEPERSATDLSQMYGDLGLSFVVWETEWEYKTDGGGVDVDRLLTPWRQLRPKAYTAVATEGQVPETFNHKAAIRHGCRYLPETYSRLGPQYDPAAAIVKAVKLGWAATLVHPTASAVEGHVLAEELLRCYRAPNRSTTTGLALWRADMFTANDFDVLRLVSGHLFLQ